MEWILIIVFVMHNGWGVPVASTSQTISFKTHDGCLKGAEVAKAQGAENVICIQQQ